MGGGGVGGGGVGGGGVGGGGVGGGGVGGGATGATSLSVNVALGSHDVVATSHVDPATGLEIAVGTVE